MANKDLTNIKKMIGLAETIYKRGQKAYARYKNSTDGNPTDNYLESQKYYKMSKEKAENAKKTMKEKNINDIDTINRINDLLSLINKFKHN